MFRPNPVETGRVTLVQANDTVRSIVTASPAPSTTSTLTSSFAPPTSMSKQPVRVLSRPPPPGGGGGRVTPMIGSTAGGGGGGSGQMGNGGGQYHQQHHGMPQTRFNGGGMNGGGAVPPPRSYAELVEIAEQQRRQIEANRKEEERRTGLIARGQHLHARPGDLTAHVRSLRRDVAEGELELKRLTELERETRSLRARNEDTAKQVDMLTRTAEEEQMLLRKAAGKVDCLRAQLDELHRRRRAAAAAALVEQKRMQTAQAHAAQMQALRASSVATPTLSMADGGPGAATQRPRASVEPFQIQPTKTPEETTLKGMDKDEIDGRLDHPPTPSSSASSIAAPTASSATATPAPGLTLAGGKIRVAEQLVTMTSSNQRTTMVTTSSATTTTKEVGLQKREDVSPSPPKDPHPTSIPGEPSSIAPAALEPQEPEAHARLRGGKTDLVSLRADSLKATKRRSWAASESTMSSELDTVRRVLLEQQLKGRSHYIPQLGAASPSSSSPSSSFSASAAGSIGGGVSTSTTDTPPSTSVAAVADENKPDYEDEEMRSDDVAFGTSCSSATETTSTAASSAVERPTTLGGVQAAAPNNTDDGSSGAEDDSLYSTRSSEGAVIEMEVQKPPKTVKGILRADGRPGSGRRIEFDPLALLLDAALEGEIDLVKESAKKLSDVSASNDEGITALHNAICAGHYEIVRFLIDANADVNAQDSDGWTPLHCAASCNNLPMVRVLVEGGACVLSSTLSDLETPVQKCEEEEDGYDGCLRYLIAAHNATGTSNGGLVYAAYAYVAERDDELSFEGGDRLRVIEKDSADVDNGWWMCEKLNEDGGKEQGLAPRTYLALYPPLKYRKKLAFVPFDFALEANNNDKDQQK